MTETTTDIVEKFAPVNGNWYVDTYDSYTEVGMESMDSFSRFIAELDNRSIENDIINSGIDEWYVAYVHR
jgi:hypothetical protein